MTDLPKSEAPISEADAANELMRLARAIKRANLKYHAEDAPEISDAEYDALVRRNAVLEAAFPHLVRHDSPSQAVGHEVSASPLAKVAHEVRMMSLDNAFSDEELGEWLDPVLDMAGAAQEVAVVFNNNHADFALRSATRFTEMVRDRRDPSS